jgi:DNA repair ATPase RecN
LTQVFRFSPARPAPANPSCSILSLALGGRGDGSLVRHGADKGQVTAVFDVGADHPARKLLRSNDIDDDGDLVFRRVQSGDGRTGFSSTTSLPAWR